MRTDIGGKNMMIIELPKKYDSFFKELYETHPEAVTINYSKNFSGGNETIEIAIALSSIMVPAMVTVLKAILKHIQELKRINKENPDEVTIKAKKSDVEIEVILKGSDITKESNIDGLVDKIIKKASKK